MNDPANTFVAALDSAVPYTPQIDGWMQDSPGDFLNRLVRFGVSGLEPVHSHSFNSRYENAQSIRSSSSMAPQIHQSHASNASDYPPSLRSCHTQTDATTESSISTSAAYQCGGYPVLEEVDGVLVLPLSEVSAPEFECVFWFINCSYVSRNESEWKTHCLSHFRGRALPRSVQCPLCDWETSSNDGSTAWGFKMHHLAREHLAFGQTLKTARPDFHLFQHLWQQHLIGDQDLKELKGGNHNLTHPPTNYVTTERRRTRPERDSGRQGLQHIPARRLQPS